MLGTSDRRNLCVADAWGAKLVCRRVLFYRSGKQGLWEHNYELREGRVDLNWKQTKPRRTRILVWEGSTSLSFDEHSNDLFSGLLNLLTVSQSVRLLEFNGVPVFSPNWVRYTRMKDFPKLEILRVNACALWTWETIRLDNDFSQSILDLDVERDIHFTIDVLPWFGREHPEYTSRGQYPGLDTHSLHKRLPSFLPYGSPTADRPATYATTDPSLLNIETSNTTNDTTTTVPTARWENARVKEWPSGHEDMVDKVRQGFRCLVPTRTGRETLPDFLTPLSLTKPI
ncbi:hypothetical protein DTO027B9_661 [Paecilomyces variotii]|nr:hypothetical protein DTO027B9_661 [Paecilomyces variotii]